MHIPVLLNEVISGLDLKQGEVVLDGTINGGGHSEAIAKALDGHVTIIGIDLDAKALKSAEERVGKIADKLILRQSNFAEMDKVAKSAGQNRVDKIVLDLGLSSNQLESSGRGFSFDKNEPLLMTFKENPDSEDVTAREIVNEWSEESIADIIFGFGEERASRKIAKAIVERREIKPIETSADLAEIVRAVTERFVKGRKIDSATKTFQAIRIAVNNEVEVLKTGLLRAIELLNPNGRLAVISFHSLEDRIVKQLFREKAKEGEVTILTKRPITPSEEEIKDNRRSRSAKLRIIQKI